MINSQAKPKVLVADDEQVIADTLAIILNQSGFEATAVYNGEKAVETARTLRPDMLISDVIMTDMNGIDAAITIRGMLPNCKILLFSGQAATADLLDRARVQGHEFEILAKPVHPAGPPGPSSQLRALSPYRSPGAPHPDFLVVSGFPELHAPLLKERRTRDPVEGCVQEIRGISLVFREM